MPKFSRAEGPLTIRLSEAPAAWSVDSLRRQPMLDLPPHLGHTAVVVDRRAPTPERSNKLWRCSAPGCRVEVEAPVRPARHSAHRLYEMQEVSEGGVR